MTLHLPQQQARRSGTRGCSSEDCGPGIAHAMMHRVPLKSARAWLAHHYSHHFAQAAPFPTHHALNSDYLAVESAFHRIQSFATRPWSDAEIHRRRLALLGLDAPTGWILVSGDPEIKRKVEMDQFADRIQFVDFALFMHLVRKRLEDPERHVGIGDPIRAVGLEILGSWPKKAYVFENVQLNDLPEALIIRRLIAGLMGNGDVSVGMLAQRPPEDWYPCGPLEDVYRARVASFLHARCHVMTIAE